MVNRILSYLSANMKFAPTYGELASEVEELRERVEYLSELNEDALVANAKLSTILLDVLRAIDEGLFE